MARLAALLVAALLACGCDMSPQAVRTGGTGSPSKAATVASGAITGLGDVVVNGIAFDATGASVTVNGVPGRPVSDLALGMVVEVRGQVDEAARTGLAESIAASALLQGAVGAVDTAAREMTVLGQRVEVSGHAALQGASSLADLRAGDRVTVYGFWDYFAGHVDATRVEVAPANPAAAIIGRVGAVTGTRFAIGSLQVETAGAVLTGLEAGLAAGRYVEARGTIDAGGVLRAASVAGRSEFDPVEGVQTEVEGYVSDFAGPATFRVLGVPISAATASVAGQASLLGNGALVEVEGRIEQGVLVAARVVVKAGPSQATPPAEVTVAGYVSDFVSASSFRVLDQVVDASGATFSGGTAADLANGRNVEVTGFVEGAVLRATRVRLFEPPVPEGTRYTVSGAIESFVSPASFSVAGQAVVAGAATTYSGGTAADLANGRQVTVSGLLAGGVLAAWTIVIEPVAPPAAVSLTGYVTDFVSPASFRVNNQAIAAGAQTLFEGGTAADLANGRRVTVDGLLWGGVVSATRVAFLREPTSGQDAEVEGRITEFVSVSNFKVQGQVVDATAATYSHGGPGDLANGLQVHATGPITGGVLRARTLEIDN